MDKPSLENSFYTSERVANDVIKIREHVLKQYFRDNPEERVRGKHKRTLEIDGTETEVESKPNADYSLRRARVLAEYGWACIKCGDKHSEIILKKRLAPKHLTGESLLNWLEKNHFPPDAIDLICRSCYYQHK